MSHCIRKCHTGWESRGQKKKVELASGWFWWRGKWKPTLVLLIYGDATDGIEDDSDDEDSTTMMLSIPPKWWWWWWWQYNRPDDYDDEDSKYKDEYDDEDDDDDNTMMRGAIRPALPPPWLSSRPKPAPHVTSHAALLQLFFLNKKLQNPRLPFGNLSKKSQTTFLQKSHHYN